MTATGDGAEQVVPAGDAGVSAPGASTNGAAPAGRTVVARVVALNQPYMQNRLGAAQLNGMIFALQRDVVPTGYVPASGTPPLPPNQWKPGAVRLREDKRARPIVLRCRVGDSLLIQLQNLLPDDAAQAQVGLHLEGLELLPATPADIAVLARLPDVLDVLKNPQPQAGIDSDGTWAGANLGSPGYPPATPAASGPGSLAAPGQTKVYKLFARAEGAFLLYSGADDVQRRGQIDAGLFGAVVVEPEQASIFRSQVTRADLAVATVGRSPLGQPLIDYQKRYAPRATYPSGQPIPVPTPVLDMLIDRPMAGPNISELVHSDLTAILTGPSGDGWQFKAGAPPFNENPAYPKRAQPYREFVVCYHELNSNTQGLPQFNAGPIASLLGNGKDGFAINYGVSGIGPEILANRLGVGPMGRPDAVDLKFEEFFLSSWAVGDPALLVDVPANADAQVVTNPEGQPPKTPAHPGVAKVDQPGKFRAPKPTGQGATKAYYPDDPSNVYHSYLRDHVKFRILHAAKLAHVHHLHAHQWLHSPDSDESQYLDSQLINGGISYTQEIAHGGSGNRNLTAGDSIFHCHFYPHFAQGMWSLWRVHDVLEEGTKIDPRTGRPIQGQPNRALPDGEIAAGTPIPAVVPLPSLAMAPPPAAVQLIADGRQAKVIPEADGSYKNPGYPFFVPGLGGHRAPQPPKDFAPVLDANGQPVKDNNGNLKYLDGGLPRHLIVGGELVREFHTIWDFSKDFVLMDEAQEARRNYVAKAGSAVAVNLPAEGTPIEAAAMRFHSSPPHRSFTPEGKPGRFEVNGLPAQPGAPYADPGRTDDGQPVDRKIVYKGADIQLDVVFNKKGWHYPQQRFITLWGDVADTVKGARPPEPLFFRADSKTVVEYWQTNLVPNYYQMDDFQIRTPTDVIGQHIHLVKFDVTASDGAANGFNYEDSTFSPDEVRERIAAINAHQDWYTFDITKDQYRGTKIARPLQVERYELNYPFFGPEPAGQNWDGAQTTVQRWYADPLLDNKKRDRTLRTVFTHDHFAPSTHQQTGLYAGLLVEPEGSRWFVPDRPDKSNKYGFVEMNSRTRPVRDGGPTSWNAVVVAGSGDSASYREFALEFQDMALSYTAPSRSTYGPAYSGDPSNMTAYNFKVAQSLTADLNGADGKNVPASVIGAFNANSGGQIKLNANARVDVLRQIMQGVVVGGKLVMVPFGQWLITDPSGEYTITTPIPQPFPTSTTPPDLVVSNLLQPAIGNPFSSSVPAIKLTTPLTSGKVPKELSDQFLSNGITLSSDATVSQVAGGPSWIVVDSGMGSGLDRGEIYPMRDNSQKANATSFQVYFPLTGAWCDSPYAVYPNTNFGVPQLVSSGFQGTYSVNYRNEPLAIRVNVPRDTGEQANLDPADQPKATDLAHVLRSIPRYDRQINAQPPPDQLVDPTNSIGFQFPERPLTPGMYGYDPYTPLLRAYENDNVQVRTLVGAHQLSHTFNVHGVKWYFEPGVDNFGADPTLDNNSGFRNSQPMGISEHFEMNFVVPPAAKVAHSIDGATRYFADYPYMTDSGILSLTNGNWGLMRAYAAAGGGGPLPDLMPLPNNADRGSPGRFGRPTNVTTGQLAPERTFDIVAIGTKQALPAPGSLVYNSRGATIADANAVLYVAAGDLDWARLGVPIKSDGSPADWSRVTPDVLRKVALRAGVPVEPLVLRVDAGDFITTNLYNALDPTAQVFTSGVSPQAPFGANGSPAAGTLPNLQIFMSADVGLHPHLLSYDMSDSNGINAGWNPITTAGPMESGAVQLSRRTYQWYAGDIRWERATGRAIGQPVEFGAVNLVAADPLLQHTHSLVAAMVVEPEGSKWDYDKDSAGRVITRTSANVTDRSNALLFREFVLLTQDDLAVSGTLNGFNFGTEPFKFRNATTTNVARAVSDQQVNADPQTPVFAVNAGTPVRWRLLHPGGRGNAEVFTIDGHVWQEEPYAKGSREIGPNPLSMWMGSRASLMPNNAYNILLERAGGVTATGGDFLYRVYDNSSFTAGWWGIMRVTEPRKDGIVITSVGLSPAGNLLVTGSTVVDARTSRLAEGVKISLVNGNAPVDVPGQVTPPSTSAVRGQWNWSFTSTGTFQVGDLGGKSLGATSTGGGAYTVPLANVAQLFPPPPPPAVLRVRAPAELRTIRELSPREIKADPVLKFRK